MKVKKAFYVCEGVEYGSGEIDKYIKKKGLTPGTPEAYQLVSANCKVVKRKVKLNVIEAILYIIGIVIAIVIAIALFIVLIPVVEALITTVIPAIAASVKALGVWVYNKIIPEQGILRKLINGTVDVYEKWVKPTLKRVEDITTTLRDRVYRVYTATIGGITQTYENLFGWVDGIQSQMNQAFTTVASVVSIVDERAGQKILAKAQEINDFIDSVTSDLFDKVIKKINEVATPILKRVDEVAALLTTKIDKTLEVAETAKKYTDFINAVPPSEQLDTMVDVQYVKEEAEEETEKTREAEKEFESYKPPKETPFEHYVKRFASSLFTEEPDELSMVEATIIQQIDDIFNEFYEVTTEIDEDVATLEEGVEDEVILQWLGGEKTFWDVLKAYGKEIVGIRKKPETLEEELEMIDEQVEEMRKWGLTEEELEENRKILRDAAIKKWNRKARREGRPERTF